MIFQTHGTLSFVICHLHVIGHLFVRAHRFASLFCLQFISWMAPDQSRYLSIPQFLHQSNGGMMPISQGHGKDPTGRWCQIALPRVLWRGRGHTFPGPGSLPAQPDLSYASFWLLFFPGWRRGTGTRRRTFAWIAATRDTLPVSGLSYRSRRCGFVGRLRREDPGDCPGQPLPAPLHSPLDIYCRGRN